MGRNRTEINVVLISGDKDIDREFFFVDEPNTIQIKKAEGKDDENFE